LFKQFSKEAVLDVLSDLAVVVIILIVTVLIVKLVRKLLNRKRTFQRIDKTHYKFFAHLMSGVIYFTGFLVIVLSVPMFRAFAAPLFAGSGVIALILGFASRHAFSNIVGGIFIAIFKPFRIGDRIKFLDQDFVGVVEDITMRHTVIRTFDNKRIIVPNSVISTKIVINENIVDNKIVRYFDIAVSFDSDVDRAIKIIKEEALAHPLCIDNRSEKEIEAGDEQVTVRLVSFSESGMNLRGVIWTKSPSDAYVLGCDLNRSVKQRFDREGIEIPYPYRTIVFKKNRKIYPLDECVPENKIESETTSDPKPKE